MRPASAALPLFLLAACPAQAGSPEDDYLRARDMDIANIRKIEAKNPSADTTGIQEKALANLEKRLTSLVGPFSVAPYPGKGKIAFDSLSENDVGFGRLDALRFGAEDGGRQAYVTTDGLLTHWLGKPEDWWAKKRRTPPSIDEALTDSEFYTFAIGMDAALTKTVDLPVARPAGASHATALLGGWAQDIGPNPVQEIIVALRRDGKVYIAQETSRTYKPIAACEAIWTEAQRKSGEASRNYAAGGSRDQKLLIRFNAVQEKAHKDYRACYRERTPKESFFPALVKEAQAVADRFGAR